MMRAAAAMSTALKNTSDMVRHSLGYEKQRDEVAEEDPPDLMVLELSEEQVRKVREKKAAAGNDEDGFELDEPKLSES